MSSFLWSYNIPNITFRLNFYCILEENQIIEFFESVGKCNHHSVEELQELQAVAHQRAEGWGGSELSPETWWLFSAEPQEGEMLT